jgi:outer membrane protein OmpA-like peptidoglycan-associated protein
MYRSRIAATVVLAATLLSTACTFSNKKEQGGVLGAVGGGAVGAVIGAVAGSTATGAIIGAAAGGAAGVIIGHQMDQKAKEIKGSVAGAEVKRVGEGLVVTFASGLLFDTDSSNLREESKRNLDNLASSLKNFGDSKILLVGHTDAQGTADYNLALSQRRAEAVATYLESRGVSASRVQIEGRGETDPVASNDSDQGRQENRRVEAAIYASDKMKADARAQAGKP